MFNLSISSVLNSIDNVAKETLEEPKRASATQIREQRKREKENDSSISLNEDDAENRNEDLESNDIDQSDNDSGKETQKKTRNDTEYRKVLIEKNKEIERLNAECLELEDQNQSLKNEVKEAWNSYKIAQEKAMFRESELMSEIQGVNKAKQQEKQNLLAQFNTMNETVQEFKEKNSVLEREKLDLLEKIGALENDILEWENRLMESNKRIEEVVAGNFSEYDQLKNELHNSQELIQSLRFEHGTIVRSLHNRQTEMESEISQLTISISEKEREIQRLSTCLEKNGSSMSSYQREKEIDLLQLRLAQLTTDLDKETEKYQELERTRRNMDLENKGLRFSLDEERKRYEQYVTDSKAKLDEMTMQLNASLKNVKEMEQANEIQSSSSLIESLRGQLQDISKQLIKKQTQLVDIQAERSALKARNLDLQTRCQRAEKQIGLIRDAEGDEYLNLLELEVETSSHKHRMNVHGGSSPYLDEGSRNSSTESSSASLRQRGMGQGSRVFSDLEKIGVVKAAPRVAQAMDILDTYTLLTGKLLRSHPWLRIGFVVYLLLLHLWVLVVLGIHTHSLELEETTLGPH